MIERFFGIPHILVAVLRLAIAGTTTAQIIQRRQLNSSFDIRYGEVEVVESAKVQSQASKGAVMGGTIGGGMASQDRRCRQAVLEAMASRVAYANEQSEAAECHVAKEVALQATTKDTVDIAMKKVRVLYET